MVVGGVMDYVIITSFCLRVIFGTTTDHLWWEDLGGVMDYVIITSFCLHVVFSTTMDHLY